MKNIIIKYILFLVSFFIILSCEKVNDWDVDPSYERLFRSLVFDIARVGATDVEIRYTQTVSADKYIFEFSKQESFVEIEKSVEILADTLTPFAPSTSPARVVYQTKFDEFDGSTVYYVRMKGIDVQTGQESLFNQNTFLTTAEQLFTHIEPFVDRIIMHWTLSDRITHITVADPVTLEELKRIEFNSTDKANGRLEIDGLNPGKSYQITIFNEDVERGTRNVRTSGIEGGEIIPILPGDDIPTLVTASVAAGKPNVILMFSGNQPYSYEDVTLPSGVHDVSITGEPDANGIKPVLNIKSLRFTDRIYGQVIFENIDIIAVSGSTFLLSLEQAGSQAVGYSFVNSKIQGFGNGVVRLNNSVTLEYISFNNCWIDKNGGWGVVNVGGAAVSLNSISFTNSTLTNLATQLMDLRTAIADIAIENCTFYNQTAAMSQLLRLEGTARPGIGKFSLSNNIFAGNNSGGRINAVNYDPHPLSFAGSYKTEELLINNQNRGFTDVTVFSGTAADLFVDPENHDFHLKSGNGFGGRGMAGDPRWFD